MSERLKRDLELLKLHFGEPENQYLADEIITEAIEKIEELKEYRDLDEKGLLLRLPCKDWLDVVFGEQTTFWGIDTDYDENPIREISVDNSNRITWYEGWETVVLKGYDENGFDWEFSPADIGKTVFLTQSEAEEKLREMEAGK